MQMSEWQQAGNALSDIQESFWATSVNLVYNSFLVERKNIVFHFHLFGI